MHKPGFWATFATLLCLALLCGLGSWQVHRLHWKEALLAKLEQVYQNPDPASMRSSDIAQLAANNDFAAAKLRGHFIPGKEIALGVRLWQGEMGYHVLAPFVLRDGGVVLVNRGWVPLAKKELSKRPGSKAPAGNVTVIGILHRPERDNPFVPPNDPAAGLWYRWDLPSMAKTFGVRQVAPMVLYVTQPKSTGGALPVTAALRWELPNSHFYYACFWFTMAGVLAVMYYLRFIKKSAAPAAA